MSLSIYFDAGNSALKAWLLRGDVIEASFRYRYDDALSLLDALPPSFREAKPAAIFGCSVLADDAESSLIQEMQRHWQVLPQLARSAAQHLRYKNAYREMPQRLGVDRWLAVMAAANPERTVCVVDCGTAYTLDVVQADGQHLGGYILPGLSMMAQSLATKTAKIVIDAAYAQQTCLGISTTEAVTQGALAALAALTEKVSQQYDADVVITGGDGALLKQVLSAPCHYDADLLLRGLQRYFQRD
jgi:type III pantothenate kinase